MASPVPNTDAALEFLERWRPGGPWTLTAISTDKKSIQTVTFSDAARAHAWVDSNNGVRNVYFMVNPTLHKVGKKAEKTDVAAMDWLHVDIDPRVGEDIDEERQRALAMLMDPPRGEVPPPTVIVFSGGGYQGFWKLRESIRLDGDLPRVEDAERYNRQLELVFSADACHNADRIMRLPGTINIPDSRKAAKGRVPTLAELVSWDDSQHDIARFRQAPKLQESGSGIAASAASKVHIGGNVPRLNTVDDLDEWQVPERIKVIIVQGSHPDEIKDGDSSRSAWLFDVVCSLVRAEVPDETIYSVITDPCFAISESVLDKGSTSNCNRYALRQIAQAKEHAIDPALGRLNQRYAVIRNIGGKCRVIEEQADPGLHGRSRITAQTFGDFVNAYLNEVVQSGTTSKGQPQFVPLGKWWLHHSQRRTFDRIVFSPGTEVDGAYNLWRGFAVEPRAGDCSLFLEHLRANVCSRNEEHYAYLISWMARVVQYPDTPGEVAVVLRGGQGTGKGFLAREFGRLFGRHFLQISDPKHLVGSFNAHLRDVVLLFADEAFYAGDKKHESILKAHITEPTIQIEAKHVDSEPFANYLHFILASNSDWVVPAGARERRFFVLDVSEAHQQDETYFDAISEQLKSGGYEALLHMLLNHDLEGFRVRRVPKTDALHDQRVLTLSPQEEWWYRKLRDGQIFQGRPWPDKVQRSKLLEEYVTYARNFNVVRRTSPTALGKFISKVCPSIRSAQLRQGEARPWFYLLPTLEQAREEWCRIYGPEAWPDVVEVVDAADPEDEEAF